MHRKNAFTIIEIMIVLLIMGLLMAMAFPSFYRARLVTRKAVCINNLRQIEAAISRWALDNSITTGASIDTQQETEIYTYVRGDVLQCPSGGAYNMGTVGVHPQATCEVEDHALIEE